ncbi:unnamed protein product [Prunus armeniaca]|uniref:Uncharacterized protein n=1 Tax=Prunus armeniaca TaxID=36596 RepID=A0A6J5VKR1_PRUAR|nr:unnamed protein product [Prunus armeniaca]
MEGEEVSGTWALFTQAAERQGLTESFGACGGFRKRGVRRKFQHIRASAEGVFVKQPSVGLKSLVSEIRDWTRVTCVLAESLELGRDFHGLLKFAAWPLPFGKGA